MFLTIDTVYHLSKTVKRQSNSKNNHWCTNRHMSTQSPPNTQIRANAATLRNLHHMCLGSGHSSRPWAGLTVCVYMDVHASGSRSLPRAATLSSRILMMSAARLVCQRPSSNFPYFWTPLANISALPPELRRIR